MNKLNDPPTETTQSIVLIGLMGAGKTTIGRHLAEALGMPFVDSDDEVVRAAGCSIQDIFEVYGEAAFRDVETRVITRLLEEGPCVIATGGGAYMNPETRDHIQRLAISVWLRADLDILVSRTTGRTGRTLLGDGDPTDKLQQLMDLRYPTYANADIVVETGAESAEKTTKRVQTALLELTGNDG